MEETKPISALFTEALQNKDLPQIILKGQTEQTSVFIWGMRALIGRNDLQAKWAIIAQSAECASFERLLSLMKVVTDSARWTMLKWELQRAGREASAQLEMLCKEIYNEEAVLDHHAYKQQAAQTKALNKDFVLFINRGCWT